jgi:Fe2+ transport system protein FeoA
MTLADLKDHDCFLIQKTRIKGEIGKRMADMGLSKGEKGQILRHAPLGDPILILIRGYQLSLRRSEAKGIEVVLVNTASDSNEKQGKTCDE